MKKTKKYGPRGDYGDAILKLMQTGKPLCVTSIMTRLRIPKKKFSSVYRLVRAIVGSGLYEIKTLKVDSSHGPRTTFYRMGA